MKLSVILATAALVAEATCSVATITGSPLEKRARKVIVNPEYKKIQEEKAMKEAGIEPTSTDDSPRPWRRTIYGDKVEIVTPTVIAGVTFSAKPPIQTNGMEPWISLQKNGLPKTIKPELKNGITKKPSPTYGTYFAIATTVTYNKEQLKAHNMADDEVFTEVDHIPEDTTYQSLNPLIRCTPDRYFKKGLGKDIVSEPFCTPQDNQVLKMDQTYFVSWYSRFFSDDVTNVKIHLALVEESARYKGMRKRSEVIENGGKVKNALFSSEWISKDQGYLPITILEDWIGANYFTKKMLISIQADNIEDEEFELLDKYVVVEIAKGTKVGKGQHQDLKKLEEKQRALAMGYEIEESISEKWMIMMAMPTAVAITALVMYFFVMINKGSTDLSFLRKKRALGKDTHNRRILFKGKKKGAYTSLPQFQKDIELEDVGKKD
ncbi:PMA1 stabilization in the Golgi protein 1 [[Candida] anglica]|uniref:PMA1 stabilization in the Golgi protein 1 n=1 Tax=[Candida] anglica TaxID=148631 RepID=A0ABP0EB81_9ASCO